jgi:hypothetical protein
MACSDADEEAVHHGALLMPLQLSEPTGLCSLQAADSPAERTRKGSKAAAAAAAAAALDVQHAKQQADRQQQQQAAISSVNGGGDSCVYYGWELLPSGAASPCGAVHSSMLDLFADVPGDDVVTSRWVTVGA